MQDLVDPSIEHQLGKRLESSPRALGRDELAQFGSRSTLCIAPHSVENLVIES